MTTEDQPKCSVAHNIDGVIPATTDTHFDGRTCMCGKFMYKAEMCTCPANPHLELKTYSNPDYNEFA